MAEKSTGQAFSLIEDPANGWIWRPRSASHPARQTGAAGKRLINGGEL